MEADVCDGGVCLDVNQTDKTIANAATVGHQCTENTNQTNTQFENVKNQNDVDDYYEVISADGSVGGDDIDINDLHNEPINVGISRAGFAVSDDRSLTDTCAFIDLPFVPKFEFSPDSGENENDRVSNYGVLRVNRLNSNNIPRPDKNFTVPPPNFKPLESKLYVNFSNLEQAPVSESPNSELPSILKVENKSSVSQNPNDSGVLCNTNVDQAVKYDQKKNLAVDWLDENGDPVPGAFDYVRPDEEPDVKSSKIEYVFSVKEKKDVSDKPVESGDFVNASFLISQNVLHKNTAGHLGVPLESQLSSDNDDNDEEKKLYLASKNGTEYKAAVETVATSSLAAGKAIPENVKRDRRFKRNRFTDVKKEDTKPEEAGEKPAKSKEEVALESQAVTEILKEVQRGAARAKEQGALGWQKCPVPVTNKTFLRNTLVSTLREPYRPPSKRGRFHVGLRKGENRGSHHYKDQDDRSSSMSSRSRSRSSGRSHSSSYSHSRSGSSYSGDEHSGSRDRHKHPHWGNRKGWQPGPNQFYDEAWAAYAAHYGYPWYGPEALPMFYGPEGWPVDSYAAMYYGDPQAWMEYDAYYRQQNFNPRGMGRGFRGRGRGRGGYEGDFQGYNMGFRGAREFSRSRSRSERSHSQSRYHSHSRSRSKSESIDSRNRSCSRSLSRDRSRNRSWHRSRDGSVHRKSHEMSPDLEMKEKKKKKKKKKHKKSKKPKHSRQKEEGNNEDKGSTSLEDTGTMKSNEEDDNKDKKNDSVKKGTAGRSEGEKKHGKHKNKDKTEKNSRDTKKERKEVEDKEKKDGGKASGSLEDGRDKDRIKDDKKAKNAGQLIKKISEKGTKVRQTTDIKEHKQKDNNDGVWDDRMRNDSQGRLQKHKTDDIQGRLQKHRTDDIQGGFQKHRTDDIQGRLQKHRTDDSRERENSTGRSQRSENQDNRQRTRVQDHTVHGRDVRIGNRVEARAFEGHDSRQRNKAADHKNSDGQDVSPDTVGRSKRREIHESRQRNRADGHGDQDEKYSDSESRERNRSESQDSGQRVRLVRIDKNVKHANFNGGEREKRSESQSSRQGIKLDRHKSHENSLDASERDRRSESSNTKQGAKVNVYKHKGSDITEHDGHRDNRRREKEESFDVTGGSKTSESRERAKTDGQKHENRGNNSCVTEGDKNENRDGRERTKTEGDKSAGRSDSLHVTAKGKKVESKEIRQRNRGDTDENIRQIIKRKEWSEKIDQSMEKDNRGSKNQSSSADGQGERGKNDIEKEADKNKRLCDTDVGGHRRKKDRPDGYESEGIKTKLKENRSNNEKGSGQVRLKRNEDDNADSRDRDSKARLKHFEDVARDKAMKDDGSCKLKGGKTHHEGRYDGRSADQEYHRDGMEKSHRDKQDQINQEDLARHTETKHRKLEPDTNIINQHQPDSEHKSKLSETKDLGHNSASSEDKNVNSAKQITGRTKEATSEGKDVFAESSEKGLKTETEAIKRRKKVVKKLTAAKRMKPNEPGETARDVAAVAGSSEEEKLSLFKTLKRKKMKLKKKEVGAQGLERGRSSDVPLE